MHVKPGLNLMVTESRPNDLKPLHTSFSMCTKSRNLPGKFGHSGVSGCVLFGCYTVLNTVGMTRVIPELHVGIALYVLCSIQQRTEKRNSSDLNPTSSPELRVVNGEGPS